MKLVEYKLLWNEDSDTACGHIDDFRNKEEFIEQVKKEFKSFDGGYCEVYDVRIEPLIKTEKRIAT